MILSTTETVPGREIGAILGLVTGNTVRARHLGRDITAAFRNLVGGEIEEYTKVLAEAREQSLDRMKERALALGADAILMVRFNSTEVMQHSAEILVYGTAVKLRPED